MPKKVNPEEIIEGEVVQVISTEATLFNEVQQLESELREANPKFQQFIEKQAELRLIQSKNQEVWDHVQEQMETHNIKSIKGDWGYVTLVEKIGWDIDVATLPTKFIKKVPDTAKITATYKLENKIPAGCTKKMSKYLKKGLK